MTVCRTLRHLVLLCGLMTSSAVIAQELQRPGPVDRPTRIETQILLLDLDEISGAEQQFTASVFFNYRWHDPRLAGKWADSTFMPLSEVWHPGLLIINQKFALSGLENVVSVDPDGGVNYIQRLWGNFSQRMDLQEFPMDSHDMEVIVVTTRYDVGELEFVEYEGSPSGLSDNLSITDWNINSFSADAFEYQPTTNTPPIPAFRLRFSVTREVGYYLLKMVLPMMLIVGMSWLVFWIEPTEGGTQISVAVTSMLTLIAYQFLVSGLLPPVSYMTRLDGFILAATLIVFALLIEVIVTARLAATDRLKLARRIDIACRVAFPLAFVSLLGIVFVFA
jgi:hypothetical protein